MDILFDIRSHPIVNPDKISIFEFGISVLISVLIFKPVFQMGTSAAIPIFILAPRPASPQAANSSGLSQCRGVDDVFILGLAAAATGRAGITAQPASIEQLDLAGICLE